MEKRQILRAQALYYLVTGITPVVSMRLFERITGPKTDKWLVQMVGLLAASIGVTLLAGTGEDEIDDVVLTLALTSALSFAAIDVVYTAKRRISPVYLADAALEAAFTAMLILNA